MPATNRTPMPSPQTAVSKLRAGALTPLCVEARDQEELGEQAVRHGEHHERRAEGAAEAASGAERRERDERAVEGEKREQVSRLREVEPGVALEADAEKPDRRHDPSREHRVYEQLQPAAHERSAPSPEREAGEQ